MRGRRTVLSLFLVGLLQIGVVVPDQVVFRTPARAQLPEAARDGAQEPDAPAERTEQQGKRTKYSKTFHNPDGSFTAEIYPDPIHFKDQGGAWREIDPTLEPCNASGCAFRNKAGPTSIQFADSAAADEIVAIHDKSLKAAFGLQGANDSQAEVDGNRVVYEDVYAGVDLVFEVDGTNVKELIVLNGPPLLENPVFRFPLGLTQSRAVERADGSVDIVDNQGRTEFSIPHLFMTDSSVDPQSDEPAFSEDVRMSLETRDRGQVLVVTPDAAWLRDPRRVYPVTIDPSINDNPSRDTYVQSNISNTGQGGLSELKAGTYDGGATVARSLIKFDISAVRGANISEATLSIFNNHSWSCNARSVDVHRLLDDWAEGVTWPNRPRFGADVFASKSVAFGYTGCASQRIEFGVADMVRNWASGAWDNHGFGIKARSESDNYGWKKFASSEATSKPQLSVTYNHPPKEPTSLQPACGTTNDNRLPTFSALYDDPNSGDGGWLDFEVYRDLDGDGVFTDLSRSGRGTFADPGQRSSWTPDRPLDEGVAYKWRVRAFDHNEYSAWSDSGGANKCAYNTTAAVPTVSVWSTTGHPECITSTEAWLANDDPGFEWSASDASGIAGYSFDFNQDRYYDPPRLNRSTATSHRAFDVADGRWYFHVRAVDNAGYWSDIARYGVCVDDTPPPMSSASSSSHPDPNAWSSNNDPSFSWSASDTSGINGYSYELTQNPSPSFPSGDTSEGTGTSKSYLDVAPGEWYFHVRARNGSNLWGTPRTVPIRIDDATGPKLSVSSTTGHPDCIPADAWVANDDPGFRWSATDPSGVAGYSFDLNQDRFHEPIRAVRSNATSQGYSDLGDGRWYFHVRALDNAGYWSDTKRFGVCIDDTPPRMSTLESTTHPDPTVWVANDDPAFRWSANDTSGITGYSYELTQSSSPAFPLNDVSEGTATTKTYTDIATGEWYFHIRSLNGSNQWGDPATVKVRIDVSGPTQPTVTSSTHPDQTLHYPSNDPQVSWSASDSESGIDGYSYVLDQNSGTDPDLTSEGTATSKVYQDLDEGTHWFHVRARNGAKSWGRTAHFRINVDSLGPDGPTVSSPSHPKGPNGETLWYSKDDADFEWSATDTSGINGYSHLLDGASDTTPDDGSEGTGTTRSFLNVADGIHFFHVKARNGAGVWGDPAHYEIRVDTKKPTRPGAVTSTSHTPLVAFDNRRITMTWSAGEDLPPEGSPLTAVSGVKGYSWAFTTSETPPALDASVETPPGETTDTSDELFDGVYFFHVATVDNADNLSEVATYGPMVVDEDGAPISLSPTLDDILVAHSDELGLEQFYPYRSTGLGTATGFTHLRTGNLVVRKNITRIPGVGLNTVLRHTYNAKRSEGMLRQSGVGRGWTLSVSDLDAGVEGAANAVTSIDLNSSIIPTEFVNQALATAGFLIEFTDGDGTTHRFIRRDPSPGGRWDSPPGVGLKVREVTDPTTGQVTEYQLVRPDGVTYHARKVPVQAGEGITIDGPVWRIGSITDRNGNELSFSYTAFGNDVTDVRATEIRHDRFSEPLVTMSYDSAGTLQEIVSLPGFSADDPGTVDETPRSWERRYRFSIDTEGLLRSIVENFESSRARTTVFGYAGTPNDADARNEQTDVEDVRVLEEVTDPRGNVTGLEYDVPGTGTLRLTGLVDRRGKSWTYRYAQPDPSSGEVVTTVNTPVANSATKYRISPRRRISEADARLAGGNILDIEDPGNNSGPGKNSYQWEQNRLVKKTNPTGNVTEMTYDDLGMLRSVETPAPNAERSNPALPSGAPTTRVRTTFAYDYKGGVGGCSPPAEPAAGPISHEGFCSTIADMDKAVAAASHSAQSRTTDFTYDADGNLTEAAQLDNGTEAPADPDRVVKFAYWGSGLLKHIDGPRESAPDVTWFGNRENIEQAGSPADPRYGGYSRSGQPRAIRDAKGLFKTFGYTPYGMVARIEDRAGRVTRSVYDDRDNLVETIDPSGDKATFTYDENDNKETQISPRGNAPGGAPARFTTDYSYNPNDWLEQVRGPGDTPEERPVTTTTYRDDGLKKTVGVATGQGEAITEFFYYDNGQLRRVEAPAIEQTKAITNYEYDPAGRETRVLLPKVTAAGARPERTTSYSPSGAVTSVKETSARRDDAGNVVMRVTRFAYNAHGEQIETLGPRSNANGDQAATRQSFNSFGEVFEMRRRVDTSKWLEYAYSYDRGGNQKSVTQPMGAGETLTTSYDYDSLNRLIRQTDPFNPGHTTEFSYLPEGQQDKRTDLHAGVVTRVTDTTYNADYTVRSIVATDRSKDGSPTVATCNWADGADPGSGYDANGNSRATRTVKGSSGCAGGETVRTETFDYDEHDWVTRKTETIDYPGDPAPVSRTQTFAHRRDGVLAHTEWDGKRTTYEHLDSGWLREVTDWRGAPSSKSSMTYFPSGGLATANLGSGVATADFGYRPDGSVASLVWNARGQTQAVRSHTDITYDLGGLRLSEDVSILHPATAVAADAGGRASFTYDLANRLTSWTSPFRLEELEQTSTHHTTYDLDDGGNIVKEVVSVTPGGETKQQNTMDYVDGRLHSRTAKSFGLVPGSNPTTNQTFSYTGLGEERERRATTTAGLTEIVDTTATSYDPAGRTSRVDNDQRVNGVAGDPQADVEYLYDATGQVIARKEESATETTTKLFFYWGATTRLAEETTASGATKVRYLVDSSGRTMAEQRYKNGVSGEPDPNQVTWTWLLRDPDGNVGTELRDDGTVEAQKSYDPYGSPDKGGTGKQAGEEDSTLGFQGAHTDEETGNVLLGPRIYDPTTDRFTTADTLVSSGGDLSLATDPLTGNRYLFAAANPVAFFENGYEPCPKGMNCNELYSGSGGGGGRSALINPFSSLTIGLGSPTDFGSAQPKVLTTSIPVWDLGIIRGGAFIQAATACGIDLPGPANAYCGSGDARGFSALAHATRSKISWTLNTNTGQGRIQVNPSCNELHKECVSALPLNAFLLRGDTYLQLNAAKLSASSDGNTISLNYRVLNSRFPVGYAAIMGDIAYSRTASGVSLAGSVTEYPSFESYLVGAGGTCTFTTVAETHITALQGATTSISGAC